MTPAFVNRFARGPQCPISPPAARQDTFREACIQTLGAVRARRTRRRQARQRSDAARPPLSTWASCCSSRRSSSRSSRCTSTRRSRRGQRRGQQHHQQRPRLRHRGPGPVGRLSDALAPGGASKRPGPPVDPAGPTRVWDLWPSRALGPGTLASPAHDGRSLGSCASVSCQLLVTAGCFARDNERADRAEYLGVLLVVAAIVAAIAWTDPGQAISDKLSEIVRDIAGDRSLVPDGGEAASGACVLWPSRRRRWRRRTDTRNRAVIVLDASKSMNEDAGNGGTRLDAAKKAVGTLVDRLPDGVPLGLRVYGSKVSEASRAEGCRDTELTVPVGPLDKDALTSTVNALAGQGPDADRALAARRPGRSRLARRASAASSWSPTAATTARRRIPARRPSGSPSAASTSRSRSSASRSTTAFASSCSCIAEAGGGSYVDVDDADKLGDELLALLARAFRSYEPAGPRSPAALRVSRRWGSARGSSWTRCRRTTPSAGTRSTFPRAAARSSPRPRSRRATRAGPAPSRSSCSSPRGALPRLRVQLLEDHAATGSTGRR